MPLPRFIDAWNPVIKSIFVAGMVYKARAPKAPQQTWLLDECAQLGRFPLVPKMFSIGAGQGIRPWAIFQSAAQMKALGPDADSIIMASAAVRQFFAVRDLQSATMISRMLGSQTLAFDHEQQQAQARLAKQKALQRIMGDGDIFQASLDYAHHRNAADMQTKQRRDLRTPDEVLNCPPDRQFLFIDGLQKPIYGSRRPYLEERFMAGRYHPNPYHPPADSVRVKTLMGHGHKRVIREPVPSRFAHYPQYADGYWSRIER
ncbi:MAG: TraM recognition domain-containing protein, partial [Pseudomonadota bacterium]